MHKHKPRFFACLLGATAIVPVPALAQNVSPEGAGEEIIVTAQKREQAVSDIPMAITALSGEELERRGVSTIDDVQYAVPGLSITSFNPGTQRIQLRGVSVFSGLPTVGTYLDEIPLNLDALQTGADVRTMDLERIEVLRGPQGTLYGQGAMGGTIRYITRSADLTKTSGSVSGEFGVIDDGGTDWLVNGAVGTPLIEGKLAVRIAGQYRRIGGWIDNSRSGDRDINAGYTGAVRGKLLFRPSDSFELSAFIQHQDLRIGSQTLSLDDKTVSNRASTAFASAMDLANVTMKTDLGAIQLVSASSYLKRRESVNIDFTNAFLPFLEGPTGFFGLPAGTFQSVGAGGPQNYRILNQELRLSSDDSGAFLWTIGGVYRDYRSSGTNDTQPVPDLLPFDLFSAATSSTSKSWAVFGEATYRIGDRLEATAGGRYFRDKRTQFNASSLFGGPPTIDNGADTFEAFSPRLNLLYKASETLNLYANIARGFRSGGFNLTSVGLGVAPVPLSYGPDSLWSYEAGAKFRSLNNDLTADFAVYRNEWSDVQTLAQGALPGLSFTVNGGKLSGWGAEGTVGFTPIQGLSFSLTGSYIDMRYRSDTLEHRSGDRADYVPQFTGSASTEYRFPIGQDSTAFIRADLQVTDSFQIYLRNFQTSPAFSAKQEYLNLRAGADWNGLNVEIFVKNLTNEYGDLYPAFGSLEFPSKPQPRTIGASMRFSY